MLITEDDIFYSLIDNQDVNQIKVFYKQHKSRIYINKIHADGESALHKAISTGCDKMIRFIMRLRPDIEVRSNKSWTPLHKAVHEDNLVAVNILIAHNADVNSRTKDHGKTPLHMAVFNDSMTIATSLLRNKADPNLLISSGAFQFHSALHIAVVNNHRDMVRLLLAHGVDTELRCHQGYTALWLAVLNSYSSIVECLCEYRADCDARPSAGPYRNCTPLFAAVELNKLEMIKILIHYKADVNARDDTGRTPLYHAVYLGNHETARLLVDHYADINVFTYSGDHRGSSPLFAAVTNKNFSMVKWLLSKNANVNVKRADGFTPLHCAVYSACFTVAKLLIKHRAKVNVVRGWNEHTPLHDAVQLGDGLMVNLLLHKKANVDVRNCKGQTPLFLAAGLGSWRIVHKLLKFGADPNICDNKLNSPLHAATRAKQFKTVILLVQFGANINVFNNRSQTPLFFALRSENESIINILLSHGAEFSTRSISKFNKGYFEYITDERTLQYLIDRGVNVNHQSTEGETALHRLIQVSVPEVVAYLKSLTAIITNKQSSIFIFNDETISDELVYTPMNGSGIHALDYHNFNAIHLAIHKRAVDLFNCCLAYGAGVSTAVNVATNTDSMKKMFLTLLNNGADINLKDKLGYTPLHLATKCQRHAYMRMLLEHGARVDIEDDTGATPLMLAVRNDDQTAVTILLGHGASNALLKSHAWRYCDQQQYTLPQVLLQFEFVKKTFIKENTWPINSNDRTHEAIVSACKQEICDLTKSYVGNSRLRFSCLVTKPVHSLVPFIRNSEIKQVLDSRLYCQAYPIFADDIKMKTGLLIIKNNEFLRCKAALGYIFDGTIPCLVVDKIIQYLDDIDHKTLSKLYDKFISDKLLI